MTSGTRDGLTLASNWQSTAPVEHPLNNQSWRYEYLPARYSKGRMVTPPGVRLSVAMPHDVAQSVLVVREDGWDRVAKSLGLSLEFQTGAPDVDAAMMLSGDVGQDLSMFFQTPVTLGALSMLFERGFDRVEFFGGRISATCRPWTTDLIDVDPPPVFVEAAGALLKLSAGLSVVPANSPSAGAKFHHAIAAQPPATWAILGTFVPGLLIFATSSTAFLSGEELVAHVWTGVLGAAAAAVAAFVVSSRRFAFRGRTIAAVAFALVTLVSTASLLGLSLLNESLDHSPPVEHVTLITSKRVTGGRSHSYKISTPSWRSDHPFEEFDLSQSVWADVRPGSSHFVVHSRSGYFGVEWLQDHRVIP